MKPKAYVETTVISYLAASPSRDIVVAAHQQLTHEWWETRDRFELVVSQAVVDEVSRGDAAVAARRLALLAQIPVLDLDDNVNEFARRLLRSHAVPSNANLDAVHIAVAAVNHVSYLVTWNCMSPTLKKRRNLDRLSTGGWAAPLTGMPAASSV